MKDHDRDKEAVRSMVDALSGGFRSVHIYDFNRGDAGAWFPWHNLSDPVSEYPWIPRDAVYIGKTLQELSRLLGPTKAAEFRILVTWYWGIEPVLPHVGDDVIVFCLGDELGRRPPYSHDVRLVAKTGGWTRRPFVSVGPLSTWSQLPVSALQELHAQLLRFPGAIRSMGRTIRRGRRAHFIEIPLAPWSFPEGPPIPFDSRRYDLSFAGSMTNEKRGLRILPQKTRSRRRLLSALNAVKRDRPGVAVEIRTFETFHEAKLVEGYGDLLMQTKLSPCPRGGFRETYRLFEAAASGCVLITETLPRRSYYEGCPAVQLHSWSELSSTVDRLLSESDSLRRRHKATLEWWWGKCSPKATAIRVAEGIDTLE